MILLAVVVGVVAVIVVVSIRSVVSVAESSVVIMCSFCCGGCDRLACATDRWFTIALSLRVLRLWS